MQFTGSLVSPECITPVQPDRRRIFDVHPLSDTKRTFASRIRASSRSPAGRGETFDLSANPRGRNSGRTRNLRRAIESYCTVLDSQNLEPEQRYGQPMPFRTNCGSKPEKIAAELTTSMAASFERRPNESTNHVVYTFARAIIGLHLKAGRRVNSERTRE